MREWIFGVNENTVEPKRNISVSYYCKRWWQAQLGFLLTLKHKSAVCLLRTWYLWMAVSLGYFWRLACLLDIIILSSRYADKINTVDALREISRKLQSLWCFPFHKSILGIPTPFTLSLLPQLPWVRRPC